MGGKKKWKILKYAWRNLKSKPLENKKKIGK